MKLLQSQKNQIFELLEKSDLSPSLFEIRDTRSLNSKIVNTKLTFKNSDFYYVFGNSRDLKNSHHAIFSPGNTTYREEKHVIGWESQLIVFNKWIEYLKREINAPDKWKRLDEEINNLGFHFEQDEDKFSYQEFEEISIKVNILRERLAKLDLLENQIVVIDSKLDLLVESAKTMKKFDWRSLFVGTFISIIIQLKVNQENAALIWSLIKDVFNEYLLN